MKHSINVLFILFAGASFAQSNTVTAPPSNSFISSYQLSRPDLLYSYNEAEQVHDYSGNWDFDNDGVKDDLYFVGTGGAHLYYYLRVVLSSDKIVRNYEWILCDMPYLGTVDELKDDTNLLPQFVVSDFDGNGADDIYINCDRSSVPNKFRNKGINSGELILTYKDRDLVIEGLRK